MLKLSHQQFINKLNLIQPNITVLSEFKSLKCKLIVKDLLGIEYFVRPDGLLNGKIPNILSAIDKTSAFKLKIKKLFPNLKVISNYTSIKEKVIVEDELGFQYKIWPWNLLQGTSSPSLTTCMNKTELFVYRLNIIHNNYYDYSKTIFKSTKDKIIIICPKHGEFIQKATEHLDSGNGCKECFKERHGGGMHSIFKYKPETELYIYLFKCYDNKEEFYKIGLSKNPFNRINQIPYKTKIICVHKGFIKDLFLVEQDYHKKFRKMNINYKPQKHFGGWSECFKINDN